MKDNVSFEPARESDIERLNRIVNEPDVARYLDLIPPVPLEKTQAFFSSMQAIRAFLWCIVVDKETIGCVGLIPEEEGTKLAHGATIFIYLERPYWGRGIGDRAVSFALSEAEGRFERVEALIVEENARSLGLFEKHGFVREGIKRKAFRCGETYSNLVLTAKVLDSRSTPGA
ncbi:MAG: GNAT family protein [Methanoculleus horonobensis]|nr:GNAT family protein [Methanoculleus horonobensis]MDD4251512.1 GNAT family protein [Methanoculleus horonobensis]